MKKTVFIFLTLLIFKQGFSQSTDTISIFEKYDKLIYTAKINYVDKDFKNALYNFKKALKIIPNDSPEIYFNAAVAALNVKDYEEAKHLIIESIRIKNASFYYFCNYDEFDPFRDNKLFEEIEHNYPIYQAEFFKNLENPEIYCELEPFSKNNSLVNKINNTYCDKKTANIYRLIEITKMYGWQEMGWHILWEQRGTYGENNEIWNFFKPFINSEIKVGKIRKSFWALFDEDAQISNHQTQIYGLFWNQLDEYPIIDIENVDKRLKKVGLPPLWYMRKVLGVKLPEAYKGNPETSSL